MSEGLRITGLYTYPIKSCGAVRHDVIDLDTFGLQWDRRWMLVDGNGRFLSQRGHPGLGRLTPEITPEELRVHAPAGPVLSVPLATERPPACRRTVQVWDDRMEAWDEGDAAANWFSAFLGQAVRLARFPDSGVRPLNPRYNTVPGATTAFADGYPLLLATEESLADLNARLARRGAHPVPMERFRPNVVLTGAERPFAEDDWHTLRSGDRHLDIVKPCSRCILTTLDPATGEAPEPGEPLATLATYRRWGPHVVFAQNVVAHGHGPLALGARVEVVSAGASNRWGIGPVSDAAA